MGDEGGGVKDEPVPAAAAVSGMGADAIGHKDVTVS